jgi:hypothetical protein
MRHLKRPEADRIAYLRAVESRVFMLWAEEIENPCQCAIMCSSLRASVRLVSRQIEILADS